MAEQNQENTGSPESSREGKVRKWAGLDQLHAERTRKEVKRVKPAKPVYTCAIHKGPTTEIHLLFVIAKVDGKKAVGLALVCRNCILQGAKLDITGLWPDAKEIEVIEVRG